MNSPARETYPLDHFIENLPNKPFCSDDLATGLRVRSKNIAINYRYIQHNHPGMKRWMVFDQDHEDYYRFEDRQLRQPNMIVRNLENRRCHVFYAIVPVCTTDMAKLKPMNFMAVVEHAYCLELGADMGYSGLVSKNACSNNFQCNEIHSHVYTLGEMAERVDLDWSILYKRRRGANDLSYGIGRNVYIFDNTRFWAYVEIWEYRPHSKDQWFIAVREKTESYNTFTNPLPLSEIKAIANSIARWVWQNYWPTKKRIRRGIMADSFDGSDIPLTLESRQRLAARRTANIKREATREKIIDAIGQLTAQNKRVTKAAVARIIGMSREKISKNYSDLFH